MAYRLKIDESVPQGINRLIENEIDSAVEELTGGGNANRDEAIHEARKSVKKIRGVFRLIRPELGNLFRRENERYRKIGRKLSEFRDAGAMLETFDHLKEKFQANWHGNDLEGVRSGLLKKKEEHEQTANIEQVLAQLADELREARKDVKKWLLNTDGFAGIKRGLKRTYRDGQLALARAQTKPRPENFHDWRKRVKDHWYHVRLLEDLWSDMMEAREKSLKELETWLGEDHNLVVLQEKIRTEPEAYGSDEETKLFLDSVAEYQRELRDQAISVGIRLYEEKPADFLKRIKHLWQARHEEPAPVA